MLAGRISQLGTLFGSDKKVPNGVEDELKRLYYEIANSANRPAMAALMNLVPHRRYSSAAIIHSFRSMRPQPE
jgi:hypothetical protein